MSDDIRVWVNGERLGADAPAIPALDHGVTRRGRGLRDLQGRRRAGLRADPALASPGPLAGRPGAPAADHAVHRRGHHRRCWTATPIAFGRLRYSVTGGAGPLGSDRGGSTADLHRHRRAAAGAASEREGRRRPVDPQRARRDRRAEDHLVRRERRGPGLCQEARRHRGDLRQHPRRALRGDRDPTSSSSRGRSCSRRRWTPAAWPASPAS